MTYVSLYRKFRPATFDDVKGQDHIVKTLKNQMNSGRLGHAYLFCGTRGTGKTSVAKILAKAVNCEHPVDGSPCNECNTCRAIQNGASTNVIEIDAASNNGVDSIRTIRDEVLYRPTSGKYKVYIIDEVHMLSTGAFNALLKTLEEPPEYIIFILATTEVNKIPITILSRCQRYDFHRISVETIANRLKELTARENIAVEEKALRYVAKAGDGSMRDALSILDQCVSFNANSILTYDQVLDILGDTDYVSFSKMLRCILENNITGAIDLLEELIYRGKEISHFVSDFTWYLRNLLLLKTDGDTSEALDISSENKRLMEEECRMVDIVTLMRYIRICSELIGQIRYSTQKRIMVEVAIIKMAKPEADTDVTSLNERVGQVETEVKENRRLLLEKASTGKTPAQAAEPTAVDHSDNTQKEASYSQPGYPKEQAPSSPCSTEKKMDEKAEEKKVDLPALYQHLVNNWPHVLARLEPYTRNILSNYVKIRVNYNGVVELYLQPIIPLQVPEGMCNYISGVIKEVTNIPNKVVCM